MTRAEKTIAGQLMKLAASEFGCHGCNDFEMPNTASNWAIVERMEAANLRITVAAWRKHADYQPRPKGKTIFTQDFGLMHYFAGLLAGG